MRNFSTYRSTTDYNTILPIYTDVHDRYFMSHSFKFWKNATILAKKYTHLPKKKIQNMKNSRLSPIPTMCYDVVTIYYRITDLSPIGDRKVTSTVERGPYCYVLYTIYL